MRGLYKQQEQQSELNEQAEGSDIIQFLEKFGYQKDGDRYYIETEEGGTLYLDNIDSADNVIDVSLDHLENLRYENLEKSQELAKQLFEWSTENASGRKADEVESMMEALQEQEQDSQIDNYERRESSNITRTVNSTDFSNLKGFLENIGYIHDNLDFSTITVENLANIYSILIDDLNLRDLSRLSYELTRVESVMDTDDFQNRISQRESENRHIDLIDRELAERLLQEMESDGIFESVPELQSWIETAYDSLGKTSETVTYRELVDILNQIPIDFEKQLPSIDRFRFQKELDIDEDSFLSWYIYRNETLFYELDSLLNESPENSDRLDAIHYIVNSTLGYSGARDLDSNYVEDYFKNNYESETIRKIVNRTIDELEQVFPDDVYIQYRNMTQMRSTLESLRDEFKDVPEKLHELIKIYRKLNATTSAEYFRRIETDLDSFVNEIEMPEDNMTRENVPIQYDNAISNLLQRLNLEVVDNNIHMKGQSIGVPMQHVINEAEMNSQLKDIVSGVVNYMTNDENTQKSDAELNEIMEELEVSLRDFDISGINEDTIDDSYNIISNLEQYIKIRDLLQTSRSELKNIPFFNKILNEGIEDNSIETIRYALNKINQNIHNGKLQELTREQTNIVVNTYNKLLRHMYVYSPDPIDYENMKNIVKPYTTREQHLRDFIESEIDRDYQWYFRNIIDEIGLTYDEQKEQVKEIIRDMYDAAMHDKPSASREVDSIETQFHEYFSKN